MEKGYYLFYNYCVELPRGVERMIKMPFLALKERKKSTNSVEEISINRLLPNPYTARRGCDRKKLSELAKSIGEVGVLQPVIVRVESEEKYRIVSGERRVKAARIAGLKVVPCIVVGVTDRRGALISMSENLQRCDVEPFEEAEGIKKMCSLYGMTWEDCAIKLGISRELLSDKLSLLNLDNDERRLCEELKLDFSVMACLGKISDKKLRKEAFKRLANGEINKDDALKIEEILKKENKNALKNSAVLGNKTLFFKTIKRAVDILNGAGGDAKIEEIFAQRETVLIISVKN